MNSEIEGATGGRVVTKLLESGVLLIQLGADDERVVTLTQERIASLREATRQAQEQQVRGVIIAGPHLDMFTAGADIKAIEEITDPVVATELAKEGQEAFAGIEQLSCPAVAAISGVCVGGGCELALACDYRIITKSDGSTIGLPEVKLGILPGFGGTQRLPRLIGLPAALDIILAGKSLKPKQALKVGLVDRVVQPEALIAEAEKLALLKRHKKQPRMGALARFLTFTAAGRWLVLRKAEPLLMKKTKGHYPAPPAALKSCKLGLERGLAFGFQHEAEELGRLLVTPESKALVRLFFLSEDSKAIGKSARSDIDQIHALVIGAGVMGAGIAGLLAQKGYQVILKDTAQEAVDRGLKQIKGSLDKLRYLQDTERSFILNRIEATTKDAPSIGNANLVIEAIVENLEIKKKVLADVAAKIPADSIITSNTSSLSLTEISEVITDPSRVAGMHFFNPVDKMPLLEIVRARDTSVRTIAMIAALATRLGKFPIVVEDVPGFLVNRILTPYLNEAGFMLRDGYGIDDIDKAAKKFGMPMGPVRLLDEVGLDVALHVSEVMNRGYGGRMDAPGQVAKLVQAGRLGKKTSGGFYDYGPKKQPERPSPKALEILGLAQKRELGDKKVVLDRLLMALINEAVLCLDEGVAGVPGPDAARQIDLGTVMGMGFPPFRGGLLYYAESIGAKNIVHTMQHLSKEFGTRFKPVEGIVVRAEKSKSFYEAI